MRDKPTSGAVDGSGFDDFLSKKAKKTRGAADLGVKGAKWPTAEEVSASMQKTGSSSDVTRAPIQFNDPAYFDPLLFFIQHRDRRELNFRLRHAYEYEPIVGNLVDLHRTLPLSDYRLVCRDKSIESEMQSFAERRELLTTSSYILGDYFLLGEAVVWKVWDDYEKEWKEITLLPPEKVELRKTYLTKTPLMLLHVDSELKKLVSSADPVDQEIVKAMDPTLVEKIRTQDRIALPPHQAVHFANKTSESDLRGTSILKRGLYALLLKYKLRLLHSTYIDRGTFPLKIFKVGDAQSKWVPSRAHFDALRNMLAQAANDPDFCFDEQTELLTENGWSKWDQIKTGDKFATMDPETGAMEYRPSTFTNIVDRDGEMIKIKNGTIDLLVTPKHELWVQPVDKDKFGNELPWRSIQAKDLTGSYRMRTIPDSWEGTFETDDALTPQFTEIIEEQEPVHVGHEGGIALATAKMCKAIKIGSGSMHLEDFVKLAGFFISEGCVWKDEAYTERQWRVQIVQNSDKAEFSADMAKISARSPFKISHTESLKGKVLHSNYGIYEPGIPQFFRDQFGQGSFNKHIPKWMKMLPTKYLKILLNSLLLGDGSCGVHNGLPFIHYYTSSKQLMEDVREISLKLGYYTNVYTIQPDKTKNKLTKPHYHIKLSSSEGRKAPRCVVSTIKKHHISIVPYKGKVFCPMVPPHFLVFARRNGKVVISKNSIIYHYGLNVEYHGAKDKWENLLPHYEWCDKELMIALFANDALLQSKGTTFSNSNVSVRVLMSRYQTIRTQLELMWKNHIFRPMAEARGHWLPDKTGSTGDLPTRWKNGKCYYLDVPNFKWSKLNLLDDTSQKQFIMRLRERNEVPHKLVAELFDLDAEELVQQIKAEEGTVVDQSYVETKKKAAGLPSVMSQVLQGRKSREWVLPTAVAEDEAKKDQVRKPDGTAAPAPAPGGGGGGGGAGGGGMAPPAPAGMPPKPVAPGAPGTPPEPTATEPGKGVMQPPI